MKSVTQKKDNDGYRPEKDGVMLLDCLERRGVVVDLGVPEGVAAGGGGPARVCVLEAEAAKVACNSSSCE